MAARGKDFKVLVFMGTQAAMQVVDRLKEYTEYVYAVVAPEYGYREHPMGNLTLISNYLDDAGMQRWIERVPFDLIIDGVSVDRPDISENIKAAAERNHIDYLKVIDKLNLISRVTICRTEEEFSDRISSLLGVIVADSPDAYRMAAEHFRVIHRQTDSLFAVVPPEEDEIRKLQEAGCESSHIFCFGKLPSSDFMAIFFSEYNVEYFILDGNRRSNLVRKLEAVDRSNVKAIIMGDPNTGEGLTADKAVRQIRKTYELSRL